IAAVLGQLVLDLAMHLLAQGGGQALGERRQRGALRRWLAVPARVVGAAERPEAKVSQGRVGTQSHNRIEHPVDQCVRYSGVYGLAIILTLSTAGQRPCSFRRGSVSCITRTKKGSSHFPGERGLDFQEEVARVAKSIGHALDDLDAVVHSLDEAGVHWKARAGEDAPGVSAQVAGKA